MTTVTVDQPYIERAIAVLATQRGSVRGVQLGLELLFQTSRSLGYISQTLTALGARATAQHDACGVPLPVLAEADEIFQGHQPCLTVVDGRSFLVLNLTPAAARDATTWGVTFLDLQARGVQFQDLASDGGTGIRAGAAAAQLAVPLRPDLFHLLREAGRVGQRLEHQTYQALQLAERCDSRTGFSPWHQQYARAGANRIVCFGHVVGFAQKGSDLIIRGGRRDMCAIPNVRGGEANAVKIALGLDFDRVDLNLEACGLAVDVIAEASCWSKHKKLTTTHR